MRGRLVLFLLTLGTSVEAAGPLDGLVRLGSVGFVEVVTDENGTLVGRYRGDGACGFAAGQTLLWGQFEGDVFVGSLWLCQRGNGCPAQGEVAFMGLLKGRLLTGFVPLSPQCMSDGLEDTRRIAIRPATDDERASLKPASASEKQRQAASAAFSAARESFNNNDFPRAIDGFERSLAQLENFWAWNGLGTAEVEMGNYPRGIVALQRALVLAKSQAPAPDDKYIGDTYLNLACAYVPMGKPRQALEALRKAFALAPDLVERSRAERKLAPLRNDPDYERLVQEAKNQQARPVARPPSRRRP